MKTPNTSNKTIVLTLTALCLLSMTTLRCSTMSDAVHGSSEGKEVAAAGPTVMNVRTEPSTVELNRDLQPLQPAEVLADVKDFRSNITEVKLQFTHVPLEIPMENIGGTTWRTQLTPRQLQMLAVSGRTIKYEATIMAKNAEGQVASSKTPVEVSIKSPDLAQTTG